MDGNRFKMLMRWLTFMAFLAGSANPRSADSGRRAVTVAPTCKVKGQPEVELILNCGDGKHEGGVQFWHTPFGDLQPSAGNSELDSVLVHHDGSLVIPVPSLLHSGLYYCVLQHSEGSTMWPYELHIDHNQNTDDKHEQNSCAAHRTRRTIRLREKKAGDSDGVFAGAVVASVLVTFVVGFSAGALTRSYVLRCWHAVTTRLSLPKQRRRQADVPDHSSQVVITTLPPLRESYTFETEMTCDGSPTCRNSESRASVTTLSPPAKPKRSFRNKEEKMGDTAYLEGCDYLEEERMEVKGGGVGATKEVSDEEETTQSCFYLEDEELQSETDEDKSTDDREEEEAEGEQERSEEEVRGENEGEKTEEFKETECFELDKSSAAAEGGENKEAAEEASAPRRRIIRVYQYDEEGQRYCHLPDPGPVGPEPAPRLKQRSLSLTRLNAIMATATAGPMEAREGEERSHFHMDI